MAVLNQLHSYIDGQLLKSSDWNDELNQILYAFGYGISNANTFQILFAGSDEVEAELHLETFSTGDFLSIGNGTLESLFKNNGQLVLGANGVVGIITSSAVKCPNLNVDLLDGVSIAALETKVYAFDAFSTYWTAGELSAFPLEKEVWIIYLGSGFITKLKAKQEGVASADASTIFTVYKNGVSIGTISIAGNTTAVQTNDIADVPITNGDRISFQCTTYTGTIKHSDVTLSVHYKRKYFQ